MDRHDEANRHFSLLKPMSLKLIYGYLVYKYVWEELKCVCSYLCVFDKLCMKACLFNFLLSHVVCRSSVTSNSDSDVVDTPLNNMSHIQCVAYHIGNILIFKIIRFS